MDQLKLEAAIQFGRINAINKMYEDEDIERLREIFESHWDNFDSNLRWRYFSEYYQDQVNMYKLFHEED